MLRNSFRVGICVVVAAVCIAFFACSATDDSPLDTSSGSGGSGHGGAGLGGGLVGGFNTGGHTGEAVGCTSDLQATVDAEGNIVAACPPDKGCFEGECIEACLAAASSKGSIGCEYWSPYPPFYQNHMSPTSYDGSCYAVFIANTWGRPAQLTVSHDGQALDVSAFARVPSGVAASTQYNPLPATGIPPGEVAVLFLSHKPGAQHGLGSSLECPITPAVTVDAAIHNSGRGRAFEVTSDTPITAYDIMPYGGAQSYLPSASLLYPHTAWGDNYYAVAPHASSSSGKLWVMLVGTADGTTVDVVPTSALPGGGGVADAPANVVTQVTIDAGEMVQWSDGDPSGAVFQSSSPIGVWTGNTYLRVQTATSPSGGGQDSAHQQIPPISALGHEYVGASVVTRLSNNGPEGVPYRLMGIVDGTQLSWDPMPAGAPATLAAGEVVEFETTELFVVSSQDEDHPFTLTQYMPGTPGATRPGCSATPPYQGMQCGLGDEEWVMQLAPEQFLQRYAFFVDPTYATANLVVTRVRSANGFADVDIDCLGTVSDWQPVGSGGNYEVAHVDLYRAGVGTTPQCETSQHLATSDGKFGITVWGTDYYASYGYPAGGNIGSINDVVVPPTPK